MSIKRETAPYVDPARTEEESALMGGVPELGNGPADDVEAPEWAEGD